MREEIPVVTYSKNEKGNWVYDLGQNFSGVIRLCVKGERGQSVRLTPAELLNRITQSISQRQESLFTLLINFGGGNVLKHGNHNSPIMVFAMWKWRVRFRQERKIRINFRL